MNRTLFLFAVLHIFIYAQAKEHSIALLCGKCTKYKDVTSGQWITNKQNCKDCVTKKEDLIKYCELMYPSVIISDIKNSSQTVLIGKWCKISDTQSCHGHTHSVTPVICISESTDVVAVKNNICNLDKLTGPCRAMFHRFYFDKNDRTCKVFVYGGCHGNENNFVTEDECKNTCGEAAAPPFGIGLGPVVLDDTMSYNEETSPKQIPSSRINPDNDVKSDFCAFKPEPGRCRAAFPRFYFDSETHSCKSFVFGGCGGNQNNFITMKECSAACSGQTQEPEVVKKTKDATGTCALDKETGPCRALFTRYYYDYVDGTCKSFIYGGCRGNDNNFMTIEDCSRTCAGSEQQPLEPSIPIIPPPEPKLKDDALDGDFFGQYKNEFNGDKTTEDDLYNKVTNFVDTQHQDTLNNILQVWEEKNSKVTSDISLSPSDKNAKLQSYEESLQEKLHNINSDHEAKKRDIDNIHNSRTSKLLDGARQDALNKLMDKLPVANGDEILEKFDNYLLSESDLKDHFNDLHNYASEVINTDSMNTISKALAELEERVNKTIDDLKSSEFVDDEMSETIDQYFVQYFSPENDETYAIEDDRDVIGFIDHMQSKEDDEDELVEIENNDDDDEIDDDWTDNAVAMGGRTALDGNEYDDMYFDVNNVKIIDPQPLIDNDGPKVAYFSGSSWLLFAGVAIGALFLVVLIAIFASNKRNATMRSQQADAESKEEKQVTLETTTGEEGQLTAEQKQLLLMQQHGYENPTYKFFEKQKS